MAEPKNKAAQQLGRRRWKGRTDAERIEHAKMMARKRWPAKPVPTVQAPESTVDAPIPTVQPETD